MGIYACTAATETEARCRHSAKEGDRDCFCPHHATLRDGGKEVKKARTPDQVLYKFNVNPNWKERLVRMGVPVTNPDFAKEEQKHTEHAQAHGRQAHRYSKNVADSGVPVFGKDGLQGISLGAMLTELRAQYKVVNIHLRPRRDGDRVMHVLVIDFSNAGTPSTLSTSAFNEVMEFLSASCWGHCHVWANPPREDGRLIHTVNSSHREPEKTASSELHFANGEWRLAS